MKIRLLILASLILSLIQAKVYVETTYISQSACNKTSNNITFTDNLRFDNFSSAIKWIEYTMNNDSKFNINDNFYSTCKILSNTIKYFNDENEKPIILISVIHDLLSCCFKKFNLCEGFSIGIQYLHLYPEIKTNINETLNECYNNPDNECLEIMKYINFVKELTVESSEEDFEIFLNDLSLYCSLNPEFTIIFPMFNHIDIIDTVDFNFVDIDNIDNIDNIDRSTL